MGHHHGQEHGKHHGNQPGHQHGQHRVRHGGGAGTTTPAEQEAWERYSAARQAYEVARYEYKAARYALKAARLRARPSGPAAVPAAPTRLPGHPDRLGHPDRPDRPREDGGGRDQGKRRQVVLEVLATERVGAGFQRITLGGPGFADVRDNPCTDKYVKILFVDPALGLEPPYDVQGLRRDLPQHQRPVRRTYTVHSVDHEAQTLAIDVLLHGSTGVAGPWAERVTVGEKVAFSGPGGKYAPDVGADSHLLVGDASALPAIEAALADLAARAPAAVGTALIEVDGPEDEREMAAPPGVDVLWLHRPSGESSASAESGESGGSAAAASVDGSGLPAAVEAIVPEAWPPGRVHAFVHGEKSMVRRLRRHLLEDRGVDRRMLSLSSYWTRGAAGD